MNNYTEHNHTQEQPPVAPLPPGFFPTDPEELAEIAAVQEDINNAVPIEDLELDVVVLPNLPNGACAG